jgi:gliding motility-associated-like protein
MKNTAQNAFLTCMLIALAGFVFPLTTSAQVSIYVGFASEQSGCEPVKVSFHPKLRFSDSARKPLIRSYEWDFGDGSPTSLVKDPVHYYRVLNGSKVQKYNVRLHITTMDWYEYDTIKHDWITVRKAPLPKVVENPGLTTIAKPEIQFDTDTLLSHNIDFRDTATKFLWSFGDIRNPDGKGVSVNRNPQYTYKDTGTYRVVLTVKGNGCTGMDSVSIYIGPQLLVFIPNIFKPDGLHNASKGANYFNGFINETFRPVLAYYNGYSMAIYNKQGELYFYSTDPTIGWNGKTNGTDCPEDVYVYTIHLKNSIGKDYSYQGIVTLVR